MPKRSDERISSKMSKMSLSKESTTTSITDLPVDVICLAFEHLPLSEVLRNQSLVCKLFYAAHLQHCRSSVKQLTLLGHYMLKKDPSKEIKQQKEVVRKQMLFEYARETNSNCSTPTINPSASHLKLVAGLEESAYAAIGTKFQSVTSLELFQPAMERHYRPITAMINAWGGGKEKNGTNSGDNATNQLTELKIFFSKEIYNLEGTELNHDNSSCCLAYLLAEALTPDKAPALRRLVIVPGNWQVALQDHHGNHNDYSGPLLAKINLSQVTEINAPDFAVIDLPKKRWDGSSDDGGGDYHFAGLRQFKFNRLLRKVGEWAGAYDDLLLRRLTGLTVTLGDSLREFFQAVPTQVAVNLRRLRLLSCQSLLSEVVQHMVVPLTTTTDTDNTDSTTTIIINDRLKELHVAWDDHNYREKFAWILKTGLNRFAPTSSPVVRFPALTTLHLVKSTLLHRASADELTALSALFPNLAHLRLDQNHRAVELATLKRYNCKNQPHCSQCVQQVWEDYLRRNPKAKQGQQFYGLLDVEAGNVQLLPSSTAPACKAALVRRAVAAWPKLASITLQIDDFFRAAYRKRAYNGGAASVSRLQYLYRCESLLLRDPVTGEPLQEEDFKWTVQEVLY